MTLFDDFLAREKRRRESESASYVALLEAELARRRGADAEMGRLFEQAKVHAEALRAAGIFKAPSLGDKKHG